MADYRKVSCFGCLKTMTSKDFLKCSSCINHYDLECANVTQRSYNSMKQNLKDTWKCESCRAKERRGTDNTNTPIRSTAQEEGRSQDNPNINVTRRKPAMAPVPTPEDETEEECGMSADNLRCLIRREIKKSITESVGEIVKQQLQSMTEILSGFKSSLSSIDAQLDSLKSTLKEKTETINVLKKDNGQLRETVERLEEHIRQSQQQALANDVDVVGIPETKGEAVVHVVMTLARKQGVPLSETDIVSADRVGAAHDETTGVCAHGRSPCD